MCGATLAVRRSALELVKDLGVQRGRQHVPVRDAVLVIALLQVACTGNPWQKCRPTRLCPTLPCCTLATLQRTKHLRIQKLLLLGRYADTKTHSLV